MKVVEVQIDRESFIKTVKEEIREFSEHVHRLRSQFQQLKANKELLPAHHMIVQMDFAENYSCRSLDEVQTAYWNQTSVTLHPVVVYFRTDEKLMHKSYVIVSDEMGHSASTVCTFLDAIIPELKQIDPQLKKIHYWTDSPSSQYRNRFIFYVLSKHKELYGCDAQWNYYEAGHGKSACDGIGGLTKRMADEALRQGSAVIQDAQDFYRWALQSSIKEISFLFVSKEVCKQKQETFNSIEIKKVKDTMKLHAIANERDGFKTRQTSCYCKICITGLFCPSWCTVKQTVTDVQHKAIAETVETEKEESLFSSLKVGNYVAAMYEHSWYIGKLEELDRTDKDCKVNFMQHAKGLFKWPNFPDILWIKEANLLCCIKEPKKSGKSGCLYKLDDADRKTIDDIYSGL